MKIKSFLLITIIIISFLAINCGRSQSPLSPDAVSNKAVLNGTVVLSGTSTTSFGAIQVGVKGTSLFTNPDGNGNFLIDNLPIGNVVVEFSVQSDVSDIQIDNVTSGEEISITVEVQSNNQAVLANMERNKKFTGELQAQIQPKKWNLNWVDSEDEVIAKISGEGYDQIKQEEGSVKLVSPEDQFEYRETSSQAWSIGGTYFIAKFDQSDAIGIITDPIPGMNYIIRVEYELEGDELDVEPLYLQDEIEIVGKTPRDSEELSIQVNPTKWNMNWEKSSGTVMVKFWGEGYEQIYTSSVVYMVGPEDPDLIEPVGVITPVGKNLTDDHLIVKFSKMEALGIIHDPTPGDKYVIRITDDPDGMGAFSFDCAIEIVGSKK